MLTELTEPNLNKKMIPLKGGDNVRRMRRFASSHRVHPVLYVAYFTYVGELLLKHVA